MILLFWLAGMLLPLNWLTMKFSLVCRYFDPVLALEWIHILAHMFLFGVLAVMVVQVFNLPFNIQTAILLGSMILITGGLQEVLQLQVKGRPFGMPEVFDLYVDIVGGLLGWLVIWFFDKQRNMRTNQNI
jgi:VanZ family protein